MAIRKKKWYATVCKQCGIAFLWYGSRSHQRHYCSPRCRYKAQHIRSEAKLGKDFLNAQQRAQKARKASSEVVYNSYNAERQRAYNKAHREHIRARDRARYWSDTKYREERIASQWLQRNHNAALNE